VSYRSATEEYYETQARSFFDRTVSKEMEPHRKRFLDHLSKGARILDAGCGSGRDTLAFLEAGYPVVAFGASQELVRLSSELTRQKTLQLRFQEIDFSNEFDGVWANASLLHVPYSEFRAVLQRLHTALTPGGVLYASFKKGDQFRNAGGREFYDQNDQTLSPLIERLFKFETSWSSEDLGGGASPEKLWYHVILKKV